MDRVLRTTLVAYLALLLGVAAFGAAPARANSDYCIIGYERSGLNLSIQVFACSYGPDDPNFSLAIELSGPGYPASQTVYSGGGYGGVEHDFLVKLPAATGAYTVLFTENLTNANAASANFSFVLSASDVGPAPTPTPPPAPVATLKPTSAPALTSTHTPTPAIIFKSASAPTVTLEPPPAPVLTSAPTPTPQLTSTPAPTPTQSSTASRNSIPAVTPPFARTASNSIFPTAAPVRESWSAGSILASGAGLGLLGLFVRRRARNRF